MIISRIVRIKELSAIKIPRFLCLNDYDYMFDYIEEKSFNRIF